MNAIATTARRDPAFADALRKAEAERELTLVRKIQEAAGEKNGWKAAAWLLERRYPDRYAARRAATMTREQVGIVLNQFAEILCRGISNRNDRLKVGAHLLRLTESLSGDAAGEQGR
ncbi:MAG: hypothetical protein K8U03_06695 [Planctomycetia bacterium]|nr:hypothetical protein [Planctomycetia bacterium]